MKVLGQLFLGDGILVKIDQFIPECNRPAALPSLGTWLNQIGTSSQDLKRKADAIVCNSYVDVVRHVPDKTWQEERESLLQPSLKRWLVVVISFNPQSTIWQQLACEKEDIDKLSVLSDVLRVQRQGAVNATQKGPSS